MIKLLVTDLDDTLYSWLGFFVPAFYAMAEEIALTSSVILSVITMIFGSLQFSSILISICIGSPPRYGYSIGKSRTDFYRFSIGGCFRNIGGNFYGNLIPVWMGG